jgi:general secretion pathway protein K
MATRHAQRGAALVLALTILAVAIALVVPFAAQERIAVARTGMLVDHEQARLAIRGLEHWVALALDDDARRNDFDYAGDRWATPVPSMPVGRGALRGEVLDLRGRLNLNGLVGENGAADETQVARTRRLFATLELDAAIVDAIVDWIDADDLERLPSGIESSYYTTIDPPYRAANRPLAHVSELLRIKGITPANYATLRPYVSALDDDPVINVNTASLPVLLALADNTSTGALAAFIVRRVSEPIERISDIKADQAFVDLDMEFGGLAVSSEWFLLRAVVVLPRAERYHRAVIHRVADRSVVQSRWSEDFE